MFNRSITLIFILIFLAFFAKGQKGKDGAKVIAATERVNEYTYLTVSAASGSTTLNVQNSNLNANGRFASSLQPGDLILIYNVMGAEINGSPDPSEPSAALPIDNTWGQILNLRDVGLYEFKEVKDVPSSSQIEINCPLTYTHGVSAFNEKVMIVRVPRYRTLNVPAGATLTCDPWNGQTGGMLVVEVDGLTTINGTVDVSELGFRGGNLNNSSGFDYSFRYAGNTDYYGGTKGEGIAGYDNELNIFGGGKGRGAPANGGGAGNSHNGGGAGGANAFIPGKTWTGKGNPSTTNPAWAAAWNLEQAGLATSSSSGGGRGGYCWSTNNGDAMVEGPGNGVWGGHNRANYGGEGGRPLNYNAGRIFFGGGGGAGHQNDGDGGNGGNAGGIFLINTYDDVVGTGNIFANGEDGEGSDQQSAPFSGQVNVDGSGGGGAGGTVLIKAYGTISNLNIEATGGAGGSQQIRVGVFGGSDVQAQGPGGGGSGGYIGLSAIGPNINLLGGENGVTNSSSLTEFPPNGATIGDTGYTQQITPNFQITTEDDTICGGASVAITATVNGSLPTGGGQLSWYSSYFSNTILHTGNTFVTPVLTNTTTFYYGGCDIPFRDSVTIFVSPPIVIDTSSMIVTHESCVRNDGSITGITVSGGTGSLDFYWNNVKTSSLDTVNLSGGTFDLVVVDSLGCSDTIDGIVVNSSNSPVIDSTGIIITEDSCGRTTGAISGINVSGGTGTYQFYLNGNSVASLNSTSLTGGSYQLVAEDANNGCSDTLNIVVPLISGPTVNLGNDTTLCTGQSLILDATNTGASYTWQDASTNPTFTVTDTGQYSVVVTQNTCVSRDTIHVSYAFGSSVSLGNDTTLCTGQTLLLDVTRSGATYTWQDASTNPTFTVNSAGQYHVAVNQSGCVQRDTVDVLYQSLSINLGTDTTLCDTETLLLDVSTPGATYLWQNASSNATYNVNSAGIYWVDVSSGVCTVRDSIDVTYSVSPSVNLGNDTTLCEDETLQLNASVAGATYTWQDASVGSTFTVSTAGQYHVEVDINGCVDRDTVNVAYQSIGVNLGNDTTLCDAQTLLLDVSQPGATYAWQNASTSANYTVNSLGVYWVDVTLGACTERDSIRVFYETSPIVNLGNDTSICEETEIFFDVTQPDASYLWDNGSLLPTRGVYEIGEYFVRVTNNCGSVSDTIHVVTRNCSCNILIPNAFTPDNDGFNDVFQPIITCDFEEYELWIFNRWGEVVFNSTNPQDFWDGKHKGRLHESAIFNWRIKYRIENKVDIESKTGHVTIIR